MENKVPPASSVLIRHRSPAYPAVDLRVAVEKAIALYRSIKRNAVPPESAYESMGFKGSSSRGSRAAAALAMYGLLSDEGSGATRKLRLTQSGVDLALMDIDDADRIRCIKDAALSPKIYREMITEWPHELPPDSAIRKFLISEKKFNPDVVAAVIKDFKTTYEFAQLRDGYTVSVGTDLDEDTEAPYSGIGTVATAKRDDTGSPLGQARYSRSESAPQSASGQRQNFVMPHQANGGIKTLSIQLPGQRDAFLSIPSDYTLEDLESVRQHVDLWKRQLAPPLRATGIPLIKFGKAVWTPPEGFDTPVVVIGYLGESGGRHYLMAEGTETGIPLDEVSYD